MSWKLRTLVAADLRSVYTSATEQEAQMRLREFEAKWVTDSPTIVKSWRTHWARCTPFFEYPPEIRKVIDTTHAMESVNMNLRKISKKWTMPIKD